MLDGRVIELRSRVDHLQNQVDVAREAERIVYQIGMNIETQRKHGFIPFPRAPHAPVEPVKFDEPTQFSEFTHARTEQSRLTAEFWRELKELQQQSSVINAN